MKNYLLQFCFLCLAVWQVNNSAFAEGTSTISPNSNILTALSTTPSRGSGSFLGCPQNNRVYFNIGDHTTENLYYGFSWRNYSSTVGLNPPIANMYMRIFDPTGLMVAQVNFPSAGAGFISTWNEASIGANVAGSNPGGYNPLTFDPVINGEYWIEVYRSSDGGNTMDPPTVWSFTPFWDLQVANNIGSRFNGRVHCNKWAFNALHPTQYYTSFDQDATPTLNAWSNDSCVIRFGFNQEFRPIAFDLAVTRYGVSNTGVYATDRKSTNNATSPTLTNGYLLFLNPPDTLFYPNSAMPRAPQLEQPIIFGCQSPFPIRYRTFQFGDVKLTLDLNGVAGYQLGTSDVQLEFFDVNPGLNTASWNGLDGLGNPVPSGTQFKLIVSSLKGRYNIPVYDAEINKYGLQAQSLSPIANPNLTLFWDDASLTNVGAICDASNNQNNLTGIGLSNTIIGTPGPAHAWSGDGNLLQLIPAPAVGTNETTNLQCDDYGNVRTINTFGWAVDLIDTVDILFVCL